MTSGTREEEGELTESSRGMVRHPKERESVQGVTGPASSREELSSQDSWKNKEGSEGTV